MCTLSVSNVIYHKFSHGAACYTLNGKNVNFMLEFTIKIKYLPKSDNIAVQVPSCQFSHSVVLCDLKSNFDNKKHYGRNSYTNSVDYQEQADQGLQFVFLSAL